MVPGKGKTDVDFTLNLVMDLAGDTDATGFCQTFQTRRNVDAVAQNVFILDDDIAEIHADAEHHSIVLRQGSIARSKFFLNLNGRSHRIHDT